LRAEHGLQLRRYGSSAAL